jgi:L-seryl-tRNA(Ser) seleniumtransferase
VINATGVVLHTGLGRSSLAAEAVAAVGELATRPQRLEIDLESAERGGRDGGCARLLTEILGCEAATVVNNNAAATLVALAALAAGRKVVLSRGELVEIGGSYRIPEIIRQSGAELAEVGTTNRTHLRDYEEALDDGTGALLKVHTSNYQVKGFTSEVEIEQLASVGREHGVPVIHDLGSGCLIELERFGLPADQLVQRSLAAGADLVCFSGDKLLGGPQAGILAGSAVAVERCRKHPLFRAMRPGRLIYTALEATLRTYLDGPEAVTARIPTLAQLTAPVDELRVRARELADLAKPPKGLQLEVAECRSQAGSGSLPLEEIPSWGIRLRSAELSAEELTRKLRLGEPAVLGRVQDDAVVLDLRTVAEDELKLVRARLESLVET